MSESNNSSKFYGLSLVIHTLLVALVIYLNFPAIKQKFQPEPVAVELQTITPKAESSAATQNQNLDAAAADSQTKSKPAPAPAVATPQAAPKSKAKTDSSSTSKAKAKTPEKAALKTTSDNKSAAKTAANTAKLKIEEFKEELAEAPVEQANKNNDEKLKSTAIALPEKSETPVAQTKVITETKIEDTAIPLPEIVTPTERPSTLQQQAREELSQTRSQIEMPSADEIREVVDLRQRPGNPLPRYSDLERLRRHEGEVVYLAYVTPEGRLTNFILTQSSGYSNLDQKTLNALKAWRFYPGQEGWVEIPQVWVLTGEAEELPSQLRR